MLETLIYDIRFASRRLRKAPLLTLAAILPMALGIGVNTAMFTVGDALLRRPLAIPDLGRLTAVVETPPERKTETSAVAPANYLDLKTYTTSFERLAAYRYEDRVLSHGDLPVPVLAAAVTPGFFPLFGALPRLGRLVDADEQQIDEVVVSHAFWRDRLGADPGVLGRAIELDSRSYTVVGIMPKSFLFPVGVEVWLPLNFTPQDANNRISHSIEVAGKLRPGVLLTQANTEASVFADRLAGDNPITNKGWGLRVVPLSERITGKMTGQYVIFLLGGVLFVLAMACSNVANLLLAQGSARQNEMAVRESLGASRGRMMSLLLTESMLIALLGVAFSLPLAAVALDLIRENMPAEVVKYIPGFDSIGMDYQVLLFALLFGFLSGVLAGITPALRFTAYDINEVLKLGGRSGVGSRTNTRLRSLLLAAEVALAMALLIGTGLMAKGVHTLSAVNPGGEPSTLLTMQISLPRSRYPDGTCDGFHSRLLETLQSIPQVVSVAEGTDIPYGNQGSFVAFTPEGAPPVSPGERRTARAEAISPSYFESLRIPLRAGRNFTPADRRGAPLVAVVNQSFATRYWPDQNAIGKRLRLDSPSGQPWITIVGIVAQVRFSWLESQNTPAIFLSSSQQTLREGFVMIRSPQARQLSSVVRQRFRSIDPSLPVLNIRTWEATIAQSMIGLSYVAVIMTVLGVIAVILASLGLFGLMSYDVRLQRNEIAIRMALGATTSRIIRMAFARSLLLTGVGIAVGSGAAILLTRVLSNLIVGVGSADPVAYVVPAATLFFAALASAYFPARQAAHGIAVRS